jgi:hypothetical protein
MQALFDEVVRFAEEGSLLRPSGPLVGDRVLVIDDFAQACDYAYRRYITDAANAWNWTDLRAHQVIEKPADLSDAELSAVQAEADTLEERLFALVSARLPPRYASLVDDIAADLENCAYIRAAFGAAVGDRLFDRMWDAYRHGGWPCGWVGAYPEGKLVVFWPR